MPVRMNDWKKVSVGYKVNILKLTKQFSLLKSHQRILLLPEQNSLQTARYESSWTMLLHRFLQNMFTLVRKYFQRNANNCVIAI